MMYKTIGLLKRRPGMSQQEFREYYETYHRVIGEKYLRNYASRYVRRYIYGFADPITGLAPDQEYDVVMEIWYHDEAAFVACNAQFADPKVMQEIADDEERLFDRPKNRFFYVEEVDSDMS